jgi:hypothetical protein
LPTTSQAKDAQDWVVTGDLATDLSRIDNVMVNGNPLKYGSALPVTEVPEPGVAGKA